MKFFHLTKKYIKKTKTEAVTYHAIPIDLNILLYFFRYIITGGK